MSKYLPPNWNLNYHSFGGPDSIKDLPEIVREHPRPDGKKRHVSITFASYEGLVPGARHIWVTIREDENPVWDGRPGPGQEEGIWRRLNDDPQASGRILSAQFAHRSSATRWAKRTLLEQFPPDRYRYSWDYRGLKYEGGKWVYGQGD